MPYAYLSLASAKQALAQRLYDASEIFITDAENGLYINEALQAFNAFANFYRFEFPITLTQTVTWYDLTAQPGSLRTLTTTDQQILNLIQYHFLEPISSAYPLLWSGSKQFSISDVLNAIQQSRDQVLSETNCTITESLIPAVQGRTFLADTAIQLRRVCWIPLAGFGFNTNCLLPSDIWAQQSFESSFVQAPPGYPITYRRSAEPPLSFDVDVQPAVPGQYDVLIVNAGSTLSTVSPTVIPIPNDWTFVNKYGAMAQLLNRESLATDTLRAQYCAMRFKQGIAAMRAAPALIASRITDVPNMIVSVTAADFYDANWQGKASGFPNAIYYAGLNLIAASPQPDGNAPYSMMATVVQNMPLPVLATDYLQVGREDVQAVLDYAQHIAMIKVGGEEFAKTFPLFANFLRHCKLYNSKLNAQSTWLEFIDGRAWEDEKVKPSFSKPTPDQVVSG